MSAVANKFHNMSLLKKMLFFLVPGMILFCLTLIFAVNVAIEDGLEKYFSESLEAKYETFRTQMENDRVLLISHISNIVFAPRCNLSEIP